MTAPVSPLLRRVAGLAARIFYRIDRIGGAACEAGRCCSCRIIPTHRLHRQRSKRADLLDDISGWLAEKEDA
jgi:hypothetical protein